MNNKKKENPQRRADPPKSPIHKTSHMFHQETVFTVFGIFLNLP